MIFSSFFTGNSRLLSLRFLFVSDSTAWIAAGIFAGVSAVWPPLGSALAIIAALLALLTTTSGAAAILFSRSPSSVRPAGRTEIIGINTAQPELASSYLRFLCGDAGRAAFERAMCLDDGERMPCVTPVGYPAAKMSMRDALLYS